MGRHRRTITRSAEETIASGSELGIRIPNRAVLCFFGEVGAGKTTFIKGLIHGITRTPLEAITSPTFVYLNVYENVYHFDLYRLSGPEAFIELGFEEYFFLDGICCIEWSERIAPLIPAHAWSITLSHLTEETREICLSEP